MAQVFVVMSNDFPDCVFSDETAANAFVDRENKLDTQRFPHRRVFWKVHPFQLDEKAGQ